MGGYMKKKLNDGNVNCVMVDMVYMQQQCYHENSKTMMFYLNNNTIQFNFIDSHIKIIINMLFNTIVYIDKDGDMSTFTLTTLNDYPNINVMEYMNMIRPMLETLAAAI